MVVSYHRTGGVNCSGILNPRSNAGTEGLRSAQIGAIHAIATHDTLRKKEAAIIVMPTGSGKTAVLMMAPFVLARRKVLVVTPSVMVRGQIYEDYKNLNTLKYVGVLNKDAQQPNVYELKSKYSE